MAEISRRLFLGATGSALAGAAGLYPTRAEAAGTVADGGIVALADGVVMLENDVLRVAVQYTAGSLRLASLFNKEAAQEYQTVAGGRRLFSYELDGTSVVAADDGGWTIGQPVTQPITMFARDGARTVGQQVRIPMTRVSPRPITVTAVFELYHGRSGLRFLTFVRNNDTARSLAITRSVVLALAFAAAPHTTYYVPNMLWKSTRGALSPLPEDTSSPGKRAELPKKAITVYDAGHGWSVTPELNWKTIRGKGNYPTDFMLPPFASIDAWSGSDHVQVITNPSALQLVLFPGEEFEYLSVNVTVFKGGIADGKMAEAEHFRRRFRYNNTSTLLHTNDWDYRGGPGRELPPDYYYTTIIPKAQAAGLDMVMLDDLWNTTRDSIEPSDAMKKSIRGLAEFSQALASRGLLLGLWFSLTGDGHVKGRDLADPAMLAFKRGQIETLITQYRLTHQMIDLTEYWQNESATSYSHPSDSVYRKAVLARRMMNDLVARYPQLLPKMTSELDIWPTQGDRNNGLVHVCHNGWNTANGGVTGESLSLRTALTGFGHLPMESAYMNGGRMSGRMEDYYSYLAVRAVKFPDDPGNANAWPARAITLMAAFNKWRKSSRVRALTEQLFRPVYLGAGWDGTQWDSSTGPYVWMYTDPSRATALVIATGAGGQRAGVTANLRWLDDTSTYMISDITLDDDGSHSYAYRGTFNGTALKRAGFPIDLRQNTSRGKAFWITRPNGNGLQVQYADEHVTTWTSAPVPGGLQVTVTGEPRASAVLVMVDPTGNKGLVKTVPLDAQGRAVVVIRASELPPPPPVSTFFADPLYLQAELLSNTRSPATVTATEISEPNASNGRWIRVDFTATGQRVEFTFEVPAEGVYEVEVRFKENASRGMSQPYLDGTPLGPEINHYYPGRVYRGIEFRERRLGVRRLAAGTHSLALESTGTSGTSYAVGVDHIKLTPTLAGTRTVVEAENAAAGSSQPVQLIPDTPASPARGGACQDLLAVGAGDWVDYRVTAPKAGDYRVTTMVKKHPVRGQFQVLAAGRPVGPVVDPYLPPSDGDYQYVEVDHGTVALDAGPATLRYAVTGRNEQSSGYRLGIDYLALTPVGRLTLSGPTSVRVGGTLRLQVGFVDLEYYTTPGYLLWSVDGASTGAAATVDDTGLITGRRAGTAVVRVRSQVDLGVAASMTVTVR